MGVKLQPGSIVKGTPDVTSFEGIGFVRSVRESQSEGTVYLVVWADAAEAEYRRDQLIRPEFHETLKAGDEWSVWKVDEVDLTAELMKVRVWENKPGIWIDVRLFGEPPSVVLAAAQAREQWLEADRAKLEWFKPGQIVVNKDEKIAKPLARPATVIRQTQPHMVELITSNGIATVQYDMLTLHSNSIQDLQAKQAQKAEEAMTRFKDEVRAKAMDAADEHGWCSEVKEILTELGIKIKVPRVRAVLHLTVEVDAELIDESSAMGRLDLDRSSNREWWAQTLNFDSDCRSVEFQDDEDVRMDSVEVRLVTAEVKEIEDTSYIEGED